MNRIKQLLTRIQNLIEPLDDRICLLYWEFANSGREELQAQIVDTEMEIHSVLSNAQDYHEIKELLKQHDLNTDDLRCLQLLHNEFTSRQESEDIARRKAEISSSIDGDYANFRAELNGRPVSANDILDVLQNCTASSVRQAVWEAGKEIGPVVAEKVQELVRLRNQTATDLGYRDYYDMSLLLQEIDEKDLISLFDNLEQLTRAPFASVKG